MSALKRDIVRNSMLSLAVRAGSASAALFSTPWLLSGLGKEQFGTYSAAVSVAGLLAFVDGGLAVSVRTHVARAYASGHLRGIGNIVFNGFLLLSAVAVVVGSLCALMLLSGHDGKPGVTSLGVAMTIFLGMYALGMPFLVLQRALEGADRTHEVTMATLIPAIWVLLFSFVLSRQGAPLLMYCLAAGGGNIALGFYVFIRFRSLHIAGPNIERKVSTTLLRGLLVDSWPMILVSIFLGLSYSLDPLIINFALGPDAVSEYALAAKITQISTLVTVSAFPILWTHFARSPASDSLAVFRLSGLFGSVGLAMAMALFFIGPRLTDLWTSGVVVPSRDLFFAFAVWSGILAFQIPISGAQTDARSLRFQASTTACMAAANVFLSLIFVRTIGVAGPVWASAISLLIFHAIPLAVRLHWSCDFERGVVTM